MKTVELNRCEYTSGSTLAVEPVCFPCPGVSLTLSKPPSLDGIGGIVSWKDASEAFNVTLEFVRRGYDEQEISQPWPGNTLRLWGDQ